MLRIDSLLVSAARGLLEDLIIAYGLYVPNIQSRRSRPALWHMQVAKGIFSILIAATRLTGKCDARNSGVCSGQFKGNVLLQ